MRTKLKAVVGGQPIHHAFDAVSEKGSYQNISAVGAHLPIELTLLSAE